MNSLGIPRSRFTVTGALSLVLCLSLVCSVSMQYGHTDRPVARTATAIKPLEVGDTAPRFIVETVNHRPFVFDPQNLERPALLIAFRGGWCPYCNMHLSELRYVVPEIDAMGIDVVFLSGDRADLLYRSLKPETRAAALGYTVLSDADGQAAIALGIAFEAPASTMERRTQKGDDIEGSSMRRRGILPVPAVFAIDTAGKVAFAYANPDYKVRLPADELLAVATGLIEGK